MVAVTDLRCTVTGCEFTPEWTVSVPESPDRSASACMKHVHLALIVVTFPLEEQCTVAVRRAIVSGGRVPPGERIEATWSQGALSIDLVRGAPGSEAVRARLLAAHDDLPDRPLPDVLLMWRHATWVRSASWTVEGERPLLYSRRGIRPVSPRTVLARFTVDAWTGAVTAIEAVVSGRPEGWVPKSGKHWARRKFRWPVTDKGGAPGWLVELLRSAWPGIELPDRLGLSSEDQIEWSERAVPWPPVASFPEVRRG